MSNLTYRVTGTGAPVVLIHGIGRSLADWSEQHALLGDRHQVWSLDLPGFGDSPPLDHGSDLAGMVRAVAEFLAAHDIGPAHVVGNSLGGAVAMGLAVDAPTRVRSLSLASSVGFGRSVTPALRILTIPYVGEILIRPRASKTARLERTLFFDGALATPERVATATRISTYPHRSAAYLDIARSLGTIAGVRARWRRTLLHAVEQTAIPTLIVWGDKDHVFPHDHLARSALSLPNATRVLFPDTGHLPHIERAEQFAAVIQRFWAGVDTETRAWSAI